MFERFTREAKRAVTVAIEEAAAEDVRAIVLTGARPNVHPEEYGHAESEAHGPFDRNRDPDIGVREA